MSVPVAGVQSGQNQWPSGTWWSCGVRQRVWYPPSHESQRRMVSPSSPQPQTRQLWTCHVEKGWAVGGSCCATMSKNVKVPAVHLLSLLGELLQLGVGGLGSPLHLRPDAAPAAKP